MGGKRIRNEEIRLIAQRIRCQRHCDEALPMGDPACHIELPGKNWSSAFFNRQLAHGAGSRGTKSAVNNRQEIDTWLPDLTKKLRPTKILDENVFHLVVIGGAMPHRAGPQKLVTNDDLEAFATIPDSASVVTIMEYVSQSEKLLSTLIVWPKSTSNNSLDQATSFHFANLVLYGRYEEATFYHWLQHVFEPQTCMKDNARKRFLLMAQTEVSCSRRIKDFCHERDIVLCDALGASSKKILPDVCDYTSRLSSTVQTLQHAYVRNRSLGMGFLEGYSDARAQVFGAEDRTVDAVPIHTASDDGDDDNSSTNEPCSTSNVEIPTAAAFEQLVLEVQHDLACLDIDKEEKDLLDYFISTAKAFASLHFNHSAEDLRKGI